MPVDLGDYATLPDVKKDAGSIDLGDYASLPDTQQPKSDLGDYASLPDLNTSKNPVDKALADTVVLTKAGLLNTKTGMISTGASQPQKFAQGDPRATAFIENAGIPTSLEGLKETGKFLIRNPVQDVKDIAQDVSQMPQRVRNFGQTVSQSPAAKVVKDPLSTESFGTYGTVFGLAVAPEIAKRVGGVDASKIGSATEVPVREVRGEVGQEAPLQKQG
jgi:hypothetical protein